jgi:hypothetical protein
MARVEHPRCPLIKDLLLVRFASIGILVLRLLYAILLFMSSRHAAILLRYSLVILGGAFSTHLKEAKGKSDSRT